MRFLVTYSLAKVSFLRKNSKKEVQFSAGFEPRSLFSIHLPLKSLSKLRFAVAKSSARLASKQDATNSSMEDYL